MGIIGECRLATHMSTVLSLLLANEENLLGLLQLLVRASRQVPGIEAVAIAPCAHHSTPALKPNLQPKSAKDVRLQDVFTPKNRIDSS